MTTEYSTFVFKAKEMRETLKLQLEMSSKLQKKANEMKTGAFSEIEMKVQPIIQKTSAVSQITDTVKDNNPEKGTPILAKKGIRII